MYRKVGQRNQTPENFELPFNGQLSRENRWVVMASLISWEKYEDVYASLFSVERGAPALNFRIGLGALIIKQKLGIVEQGNSRTNQGKPIFTIVYRPGIL